MSGELEQYKAWDMQTRIGYANTLAGARELIPRGLFDQKTGLPSPAKIFLVMETGAMLGLHPMAAMQIITVIEGKATIDPKGMIGLLRRAGHRVSIEQLGSVESGDASARVTLTRKDDPENPIVGTFTIQQALRAGLLDQYAMDVKTHMWKVRARSSKNPDKILPWEAYTEDMLVWRATSRMARFGGMDELMGIGYIPEELEAVVDAEGHVQEVPVEDVDALTAEYEAMDDKADLAEFWRTHHNDAAWDGAFDGRFRAHLSTVTKDSRQIEAPEMPAEESTEEPVEEEVVIVADDGELTEEQWEALEAARFERERAAAAVE